MSIRECWWMQYVYLDFQKTFDKVSHEKLVLKMKRMGLEDEIVLWIGNWLSDRSQWVVLNGTCGIGMGKVLGKGSVLPVTSLKRPHNSSLE